MEFLVFIIDGVIDANIAIIDCWHDYWYCCCIIDMIIDIVFVLFRLLSIYLIL